MIICLKDDKRPGKVNKWSRMVHSYVSTSSFKIVTSPWKNRFKTNTFSIKCLNHFIELIQIYQETMLSIKFLKICDLIHLPIELQGLPCLLLQIYIFFRELKGIRVSPNSPNYDYEISLLTAKSAQSMFQVFFQCKHLVWDGNCHHLLLRFRLTQNTHFLNVCARSDACWNI